MTNQDLVAAEFEGLEITLIDPPIGVSVKTVAVAKLPPNEGPIAQFPVLVADSGLQPGITSIAAAAFPTTGCLLMVTRDGHSESVTSGVPNEPMTARVVTPGANLFALDLGHMPLLSVANGMSQDLAQAQGRLGVPWGQLIWHYFTALPLSELPSQPSAVPYEAWYYNTFPLLPLVERTDAPASPFGPKVRGRINVNFAPWWVLDGLPVLPDADWTGSLATGGVNGQRVPVPAAGVPVSGLPLVEMFAGRMDPETVTDPDARAGARFMNMVMDDTAVRGLTARQYPTISPELARFIVSYREQRVGGRTANNPQPPGLLTVGGLADVLQWVPVNAKISSTVVGPLSLPLLRLFPDPANTGANEGLKHRPLSYMGYMQLVTPLARIQDWATVRGHVFTIYNVVVDSSDPPVALRTQTTIDRTRCLYTNDLPNRVLQSDPMSLTNAAADK